MHHQGVQQAGQDQQALPAINHPRFMAGILIGGFLLLSVAAVPNWSDHNSDLRWAVMTLICGALLISDLRKSIHPKWLLIPLLLGAPAMIVNPYGAYDLWIVHALCSAVLISAGIALDRMPGRFRFLDKSISIDILGKQINFIFCDAVVGVMTLIEILQIGLACWQYSQNMAPIGLFGHQNIFATFIGVVTLLQVVYARHKSARWYSILILFFAIEWMLIRFLEARSAAIGLCFGGLIIGIIADLQKLRSSTLHQRLALLMGFIAVIGTCAFCFQKMSVSQTKRTNTEVRMIRWMNTLSMIWKNPWGIGPGRYEFEYLPYARSWDIDYEANEDVIIAHAHNEIIEFVAEFGLLVSAAFFLFMSLAFVAALKSRLQFGACGLLVFIFVDSLFSFPFHLPLTCYAASISFGVVVSPLLKDLVGHAQRKVRFVSLLIGLFLLAHGSLFVFAQYLDATQAVRSKTAKIVSRLLPSYWDLAYSVAYFAVEDRNYNDAKVILERILRQTPHNFMARGLSVRIAEENENHLEYCEELKKYIDIFHGESQYRPVYQSHCL